MSHNPLFVDLGDVDMELIQVINSLHRIAGNELIMDGMGHSEPILSKKNGKLIDNFLIYFANFEEKLVSGPVAHIGLNADSQCIEYVIPCNESMFSLMPQSLMNVSEPNFTKEEYEEYEESYQAMRSIAYKSNCSDIEKNVILSYFQSLKRIVAPEMLKLYEEMVPEFFAWIKKEVDRF